MSDPVEAGTRRPVTDPALHPGPPANPMPAPVPARVAPSRRQFIVHAGGAGVLLAGAGSAGCAPRPALDRGLRLATLAQAAAELDRLAQAGALESGTAWTWAKTLAHCAQSIEYSMSGFPQPKPVLFQRTVGAAAFGVFSWRGRMTHDLTEPIPGAPALDAAADAAAVLARLRAALQAFDQWAGPLRPHFAYGALDKPAYARAHAMHLANHFSAFQPRA